MCVKISRMAKTDANSTAKKKCQDMYRNEVGAFVRATAASIQGVAKLIAVCPLFGPNNAIVLKYCGP